MLQTEFEFTLPNGYVDDAGTLHKKGTMRLATAADEILPMKDPRVANNPAYLPVILFARVVTKLGTLEGINTRIVEGLFSKDFSYLQDLYNRVNENGTDAVQTNCPQCNHDFSIRNESLGESLATQ